MPHAFKLDKELGSKGLVLLMLESQFETDDRAALIGFGLQRFPKDFPTTNAFITLREQPFGSGLDGIPACALIGVDGKLLMIGHNGDLGSKLDEAIEAELKKVQTGWGKSPEAKKIRALVYGKKKLGEAAAAAAAAEGKVKDDAKDDLAEAKAEVDAKYAGLKTAITALMEAGRFSDAKTAATELQKSVKGKAEWESEVNTLVADFAKPEIDKELKLDKSLTSLLKSMGDKKPSEELATKFKDFAKKNDGSKVGTRASVLAEAVAWKNPAVATKDKDDKDAAKKDKDKEKDTGGKD